MIIAQPKEKIAEFVHEHTSGLHFPFENFSALGLVKNNELVAGVIYNHYTKESICMHVAAIPGRKWLNREYLKACFDYPFNQLGVQRITGLVPSKNKDARRFDEHLGFVYEGTMRQALENDDMIVYGMLRNECKWL